MTKTEILSNLGIGSGINTTELIKALVDADTAPQKENLDNLGFWGRGVLWGIPHVFPFKGGSLFLSLTPIPAEGSLW